VPLNNPAMGIRGIPSADVGRDIVIIFTDIENIDGGFDVKEAFGELLVPLLADMPLVEQLNLNLAARWADYSGSGTIWSHKAGLDYQITEELRFRGTASRDVRAGNLAERFDRQQQGASLQDPLFNNATFTASQIFGGNPNVAPEKADTWTVGAVYQPNWLEGLGLSVDWYDIKVKGAIGQLGVQRIVNDCFAGSTELCANIQRDPTTNEIIVVENTFLNIDATQVRGLDVEMSYNTSVDFFGGGAESLRARIFATYLAEHSITNLGAPKVDRASATGTGLAFPRNKVTANLTYMNGPLTMFLQGRYTSSGEMHPVNWVQGINVDNSRIRSAFYTDFNISYDLGLSSGPAINLFLNVNNLFDQAPRISPQWSRFSGTATTNERVFDILGRRFVAGMRYEF